MLIIPTIWMAIITGLAGLAWLLYARSQRGRRQAVVLAWLSLPFFALFYMYAWLLFSHGTVDIRVMDTRFGIMSIALPQAIILIVLSVLYGGRNGSK